jgi:hypothetical protein
MPIYLIKNIETWSKSATFKNIVEQSPFRETWQYIIPKNLYGRGFKDLKIRENSKYRLEMFDKIIDVAREQSVVAMLVEWEEMAEQGETSAYTFMRELYKIIQYLKLFPQSGQKYIDNDSFKYLYLPEDILAFEETLADKIFWLERMGTHASDPLTEEEQKVMRGKKETIKWQNVEYEKYPECQIIDPSTGAVTGARVYALWPLGNPFARSMYMAESLANASGAYKVLSWGFYNPGGGHHGLDLYARGKMPELYTSGTGHVYFTSVDTGAMVYNYELERLKNGLNISEAAAKEKLNKQLMELEKFSPVVAVAPGIVVDCRYSSTSGFRVKIQHEKGYGYSGGTTTFYCHFKRWPLVQVGDYVGAGTIIGYEGTTGASGGNHVHFEISNSADGSYGDVYPIPYLYPMFTPFYYKEKADEAKDKGLTGSEYLSLLRTVVLDNQAYGADSINTLSTVEYQVAGTTMRGFKTVTREADGTPKLDNYVPTLPLLDNIDKLVTMDDVEPYEFKTSDVGEIGKVKYSGQDVQPLSIYFYDGQGSTHVQSPQLVSWRYNFDNNKPLLKGRNTYTEEEFQQLEAILIQHVNAAGRGTRAGVVAAARFLAGLDYAVPYRGTPMDRANDIGTYNKLGLNRTWGEKVLYTGPRPEYRGHRGTNGLDCSAFVTWAIINGGAWPPGSTGLTRSAYGKKAYCNPDTISKLQVGDIVLTIGDNPSTPIIDEFRHIAIIIGIDDENLYFAEESGGRLRMTVHKKSSLKRTTSSSKSGYCFVLCGENGIYTDRATGREKLGNITNMWY